MVRDNAKLRSSRGVLTLAALLFLPPALLIAGDEAQPTKGPPGPPEVSSIASSRVLVGYRTKSNSPLPTTAELWYTLDRGQTWHKTPEAPTGENPVPFDVPEDGLYGFYLILHAESGASAEPPKPGFAPQQWVRVDRCVPVVQLLRLAPDDRFDLNRQVYIRWGVQDDNLPDRPTALHYRTEDGKSFEPIADTLPASSSYLWTVPEGVKGRVEIKVSANDRAGNSGRYVADWLRVEDSSATVLRSPETGGQRVALPSAREAELKPNAPPRSTGTANLTVNQVASKARPTAEMAVQPAVAPSYPEPEPGPGPEALPEGAAEEARKKYDLGTWHRLRGDYAVAVARFREALGLNPGLLAARNDLAGVLYLQGDQEGAEKELTEVLAKDPEHKAALKTLALVQVTRRNYRSSAASLEKLLLLDGADAEAWLYLGDVRLFMGERSAARDAWTRAASTEAVSEEMKERAEKRLNMYRADRLAGPGPEQP